MYWGKTEIKIFIRGYFWLSVWWLLFIFFVFFFNFPNYIEHILFLWSEKVHIFKQNNENRLMCREKCLLFCFPILLSSELYWWRIRKKTYKESIGSIKTLIAGKCWFLILGNQLAGQFAGLCLVSLGRGPFSSGCCTSWGLLDTLFPRWVSLFPSLQWHFHKIFSLCFQVGLCVTNCILIRFPKFFFFFSRIPGFKGLLWGMF